MKHQINYLTQYCNRFFEFRCEGIDVDSANENQIAELQELRIKAIEQSGFTLNELTLICMCRKYNTFKKVNTYAHKIKNI